MSTVQLKHLKLLRRTPELLVIGIRPLSTQVVVVRVAIGIALIGVGWSWWPSSGILALACVALGLGIGLPTDLGETLVFDRRRDQVQRIRHRCFWPQPILRHPLSAVKNVALIRQAVDRYAEGTLIYRCQVILHLSPEVLDAAALDPSELLIGDYTLKSGTSNIPGDPRLVAEKVVDWIQSFLQTKHS